MIQHRDELNDEGLGFTKNMAMFQIRAKGTPPQEIRQYVQIRKVGLEYLISTSTLWHQ
jgi:hypothetical protein